MELSKLIKICGILALWLSFGPAKADLIPEETVGQIYAQYKRDIYPQVCEESKDTPFENMRPAVCFLNWFREETLARDESGQEFLSEIRAKIHEAQRDDLSSSSSTAWFHSPTIVWIEETSLEILRTGYAVGGISKSPATVMERAVMYSLILNNRAQPNQVARDLQPHEREHVEYVETISDIMQRNRLEVLEDVHRWVSEDLESVGLPGNLRAYMAVHKGDVAVQNHVALFVGECETLFRQFASSDKRVKAARDFRLLSGLMFEGSRKEISHVDFSRMTCDLSEANYGESRRLWTKFILSNLSELITEASFRSRESSDFSELEADTGLMAHIISNLSRGVTDDVFQEMYGALLRDVWHCNQYLESGKILDEGANGVSLTLWGTKVTKKILPQVQYLFQTNGLASVNLCGTEIADADVKAFIELLGRSHKPTDQQWVVKWYSEEDLRSAEIGDKIERAGVSGEEGEY